MTVIPKPMTIAEFEAMPDDGNPYELIHGELRLMTRPNPKHGIYMTIIGATLHAYVQRLKLGVVLTGDPDFILSEEDHTLVGPNVSFVSSQQIPNGIPDKWFNFAPALAVEILSPSDRVSEVEEKVELYLKAGSKMIWVVSPKLKTVTVYRPGEPTRVMGVGDTITGEDVIPGFSCVVQQFFNI